VPFAARRQRLGGRQAQPAARARDDHLMRQPCA
jgi:hypothetical protein